jgi:hypothetical protein
MPPNEERDDERRHGYRGERTPQREETSDSARSPGCHSQMIAVAIQGLPGNKTGGLSAARSSAGRIAGATLNRSYCSSSKSARDSASSSSVSGRSRSSSEG